MAGIGQVILSGFENQTGNTAISDRIREVNAPRQITSAPIPTPTPTSISQPILPPAPSPSTTPTQVSPIQAVLSPPAPTGIGRAITSGAGSP